LTWVIDRAGRAVDDEFDPVALLFPDGQLVGTENTDLGHVGLNNAAPPGARTAWLSIGPAGQVIYYDYDGHRSAGGRWSGCNGAARRACTYVTQLFALRDYERVLQSGPWFGIGVGVGLYY
jgi:hypothetical protein